MGREIPVSFNEAVYDDRTDSLKGKTIFNDPFLFTFPNGKYSGTEERYINIGLSANGRILILAHTERQGRIRIISCRKATPRERRFYEENSF